MARTTRNVDWWRHAGNVSDTIDIEVSEAIGSNLDAVSAVSCILFHTVSPATVTLTAAVSDSANRIVTVQMGTWLQNTATAGDEYYVTLDITAGGATITFPESLNTRPILGIV